MTYFYISTQFPMLTSKLVTVAGFILTPPTAARPANTPHSMFVVIAVSLLLS